MPRVEPLHSEANRAARSVKEDRSSASVGNLKKSLCELAGVVTLIGPQPCLPAGWRAGTRSWAVGTRRSGGKSTRRVGSGDCWVVYIKARLNSWSSPTSAM